MSKAKKKLKYAVIQNTDLEQFCKQCNSVLEKGYTVLGGISSVIDVRNQNIITYTQAFTYETNESS
jgi:hypothetical protein